MRNKASATVGLSARIREVRVSTFGDRGRAKFAQALGVSPSTYSYYERGRTPPMSILLKICEVGSVDLRWLVAEPVGNDEAGEPLSPEHARIVARIGALLPRRVQAAAALNAFLDLLESQPDVGASGASDKPRRSERRSQPRRAMRIPVLGRTAAGIPQFWKDPQQTVDLLRAMVTDPGGSVNPVRGALAGPDEALTPESAGNVYLQQLSEPVRVGELHVAEFLDCRSLPDDSPNAFALRVDGDSMVPSLLHGDLVILSPHKPAKPGRPAVVQLRNQIGVTCKLFRTEAAHVHLIPINERYQATKHALEDLVWALAVLYRVRLPR